MLERCKQNSTRLCSSWNMMATLLCPEANEDWGWSSEVSWSHHLLERSLHQQCLVQMHEEKPQGRQQFRVYCNHQSCRLEKPLSLESAPLRSSWVLWWKILWSGSSKHNRHPHHHHLYFSITVISWQLLHSHHQNRGLRVCFITRIPSSGF